VEDEIHVETKERDLELEEDDFMMTNEPEQ